MDKSGVLNRNFQFRRVYKAGRSEASRLVVTYALKKKRGELRIGVTAAKKIGNAVERNRARRIVKAAAAEVLRDAGGCFDVVFVCRRATVFSKSTELAPVLRAQLQKLGAIE